MKCHSENEYLAEWHDILGGMTVSSAAWKHLSRARRKVRNESHDAGKPVVIPLKGLCSTRPVGITQQTSVGPCCGTHLDPCSQELYQFGASREVVTEYLALDLQKR